MSPYQEIIKEIETMKIEEQSEGECGKSPVPEPGVAEEISIPEQVATKESHK